MRALAMALLCGCSAVRVHAPGLESGVDAAINVGMQVRHGDEDALLRVSERPGLKFGGHAYDTLGCARRAYAAPTASPAVVAHEIGHMLGLQHVDDTRSVMHKSAPADHDGLTSEQRRTTRREAAILSACEVIQ